MKLKLFFLVILLGMTWPSLAQVGGQNTYQFLNLPVSPKISALGGKNITSYSSDPANALANPALINFEMHNQMSANYMNYFADVNYGTASYAYELGRRTQVIQAGVTFIDYGRFDGYDESGNSTFGFGGQEAALSVGYARRIGKTDFYVGANLKLISSKLEQYTSFAGALDLGVSYIYPEWDLIVSGVVRNAGTQFKAFDEVREPLPFEVLIGISQTLKNAPIRWHITLENLQEWDIAFRNTARDVEDLSGNVTADDPGFINNTLRHAILGAELFPDGVFSIQVGYNFRRGEELRIQDQRAFSGLTGGLSVRFNNFRFSYSYAQFNRAASSSFFGLTINLQ
ncbi:type IX secretion system protein PorQ [Psychroflexus sp. YR1-1]|uniref:Type IX secretion system protein PorQ n=1 Tax=Psychroflexus aurantiacus TaxID=2709310 RepID=A0A6B3QZ92_9FLAO|nr:type IX secretion system protein PorQ [Psychroflexus aurantiacus]NEV93556.1 type IX secretion system protein PorQ [Psychroflexus aurantiacus]